MGSKYDGVKRENIQRNFDVRDILKAGKYNITKKKLVY